MKRIHNVKNNAENKEVLKEFPVKILTRRQFNRMFSRHKMFLVSGNINGTQNQNPNTKSGKAEEKVKFSPNNLMVENIDTKFPKEKFIYQGVKVLTPSIVKSIVYGGKQESSIDDHNDETKKDKEHDYKMNKRNKGV